MTSAAYWLRRALTDKIRSVKTAEKNIRMMRGIFTAAQKDILAQMEKILALAANKADVLRYLNPAELAAARKQYGALIKTALAGTDVNADALLEAMYQGGKLSRLDALLMQLDAYSAQLYGESARALKKQLADTAADAYYHKLYDFEQYAGYGMEWATLDPRKLDMLLSQNWSGKSWSARLWGHVENFTGKLKTVIGKGVMTGASIRDMSLELMKLTGQTRRNAERIVRTETAFVAENATLQCYAELDVKDYKFLATLDLKTSRVCRDLDGRVFACADALPGENYPPMHPHCRSTTVPDFGEQPREGEMRMARDPVTGKSVEVPASWDYKKWYAERVKKVPEAVIEEKKLRGRFADKKQYAKIKELLGSKTTVHSFGEFQRIKYTDPAGYYEIKTLAKAEKKLVIMREKRGIIVVDRTPQTAAPNAILDKIGKKGGIDRTFYDTDGKMFKQISNNDHDKPKYHSFGKHGEHVHDIFEDDSGKIHRKKRELTDKERKEESDLFE